MASAGARVRRAGSEVSQTTGFAAFCRRLVAEPVRDYLDALDAMRDRGYAGLALACIAFALAYHPWAAGQPNKLFKPAK